MGEAREDQLVAAERPVLVDPLGDLLVAPDERGAGVAAHEPDAGPQVRRHLEPVAAPAVQRQHALLADRGAQRAAVPARARRRRAISSSQRRATAQARSELSRAITCSRIPKRSPPLVARQRAHPLDRARRPARRLAPEQVHVRMARRDALGRRRGAAEVERRRGAGAARAPSRRRRGSGRPGSRTAPRPRRRARWPGTRRRARSAVVLEPVAEAALLGLLAAGHHVQRGAAAAQPLERRRHLRRQRRRHEPGPERHQEAQRLVSAISAAVTSQASSHQVPVGVSTPSKPRSSAARATWARYSSVGGRWPGATTPVRAPSPTPARHRRSAGTSAGPGGRHRAGICARSPQPAPRRSVAAAPRGRLAPGDLVAHERDQVAAVVDRVLVGVVAADQERRRADVDVVEQRLGDRLGRARRARSSCRPRRSRPRAASTGSGRAARRPRPPPAAAASRRSGRRPSGRKRLSTPPKAARREVGLGRREDAVRPLPGELLGRAEDRTDRDARCRAASPGRPPRPRRGCARSARPPGRAARPRSRRCRRACRRRGTRPPTSRRSRAGCAGSAASAGRSRSPRPGSRCRRSRTARPPSRRA